ncbi:MAG: beta-ketoacyl-ACP synthase III [Betaproteobacteria bacterium]
MPNRITGTGSYLPERVLTNQDLALRMETSDEWIVARTGIRQRHIADDNESTSDLALPASLAAIAAAGLVPADIDLIIVATTTPDMVFPSTACLLQAKLGIAGQPAFDVQAVCSGFVYALTIADHMLTGGPYRHALVVGAEIYSRILDWDDRGTCVLFGDGAGAVVLSKGDRAGIIASRLHADGSHADILKVPGHVDRGAIRGEPLLKMDGQGVFKFAVRVLADVGDEVLADAGMQRSEVDWLIPHQANTRIIDATAKRLGLAPSKVVTTVDRHANTSAASIPLALDTAVRDGRIQSGQHLILAGVGGGFTWGALLVRW